MCNIYTVADLRVLQLRRSCPKGARQITPTCNGISSSSRSPVPSLSLSLSDSSYIILMLSLFLKSKLWRIKLNFK